MANYFLKPEENEAKLPTWSKNVIRVILRTVLIICIIPFYVFLVLPALFLWLLNWTLVKEIWQFNDLMQEAPEEERQLIMYRLVDTLPFIAQTTRDPSAVASVNLSVNKLIEKYRENLSKDEFYTQLNKENTTNIEGYIKQSNEFKAEEKSHALKCLGFINRIEDKFQDNYGKLTLKQAAILC
ncbi:hypothetical protein [Wolbachia endosymbiont of Wuchereria bancrofti]|uniref:hypothetical protein n=1 Tax=Wolbachia endosymbiont of Wuchereria bancrofti TaxID=96496 RepID=UPI000B72D5BA|nr:hypothetical protein [Wolbachia endosymbiont of Wuchereria bancrofti]OWZ25147.1 putative membrane WF-2 domain protein [Wolbachia endosymbiont of Wuchereria bancrofti]